MNTNEPQFSWASLLRALLFTFLISVSSAFGQTGNQVAAVAAGMAAGSWAQVPQNATFGNVILCNPAVNCSAHSGNRIPYSLAGAWDAAHLKLHVNGAEHGEPVGHYMYYDIATNDWIDTCPATGSATECTIDGLPGSYITSFSVSGLSVGGASQPGVAPTSHEGVGHDATFNVTESGGSYSVTLNNAGSWYNPSSGENVLTIRGGLVGGMDGVNDLTITVTATSATGATPNTFISHGYEFITLNPTTGTVYIKQYGSLGDTPLKIWKHDIGQTGPAWTRANADFASYDGINATAWWDGTHVYGGAQGAWVQNNCTYAGGFPMPGEVLWWNPLTDSFVYTLGFATGSPSTYHCWISYSHAYNIAVLGGGNNQPDYPLIDQPKKVWKAHADGTVTPMNDSPVDIGVQQYNAVEDPLTGNILLFGNGELWELDPTADGGMGTYTKLTGAKVPPVGIFDPDTRTTHLAESVISAPISNYGVVMYVGCATSSSCEVWLYKNGATVDTGFTARCAAPGVVRCFGFDADADFVHATGMPFPSSSNNYGVIAQNGTGDYQYVTRDTTVASNGASSLKFTIPANSPPDVGSWFTNFSSDLMTQFGANTDFYVQWRQRFSPDFLTNAWTPSAGWKQVLIGTGDQGGAGFQTSCSSLEVAAQNTNHRGFPQAYNSCAGSSAHPPYSPFEEPFGSFDFKLQNARLTPYCLYSQGPNNYFSPTGNCVGYVPNEWMTFQYHIHVGPRGAGNVVSTITKSGTAAAGTGSQTNVAFDSVANSSGGYVCTGATFDISRSGGVYTVALNQRGYSCTVGAQLLITGSHLTGWISSANDLTITVATTEQNVVGAAPNDTFVNSHVDVWVARDGQASEQTFDWGPYGLVADPPGDNLRFGKIWLLPYETSRDPTPTYPVAYTWYDELIISTNRIADPTASEFVPEKHLKRFRH